MTLIQQKKSYHHNDLRNSLVNAATKMLKEGGVENISLRKLADMVGVSRTASYHYFKNKNELLCAISEQGFIHQKSNADKVLQRNDIEPKEKYRLIIYSYINYAVKNPELYDLMFGRVIWKNNAATQTLRDLAYSNFQHHLDNTKYFQDKGILPSSESALKLHKVTWATMHGLARLITDGVYADDNQIDEMCDCVVNLFTRQTQQ